MRKLFLLFVLSLLLFPTSGLAVDGSRVIEGRLADTISSKMFKGDINTESLSANKTLAITDVTEQRYVLDQDRDCTLPPEVNSTDLKFTLYNDSTVAGRDLTVKDNSSATIVTLGPGMGMMFSCDGTTWLAMDNEGITYDAVADTVTIAGAGLIVGASANGSDLKAWGGIAGSYLEWDEDSNTCGRLNITNATIRQEQLRSLNEASVAFRMYMDDDATTAESKSARAVIGETYLNAGIKNESESQYTEMTGVDGQVILEATSILNGDEVHVAGIMGEIRGSGTQTQVANIAAVSAKYNNPVNPDDGDSCLFWGWSHAGIVDYGLLIEATGSGSITTGLKFTGVGLITNEIVGQYGESIDNAIDGSWDFGTADLLAIGELHQEYTAGSDVAANYTVHDIVLDVSSLDNDSMVHVIDIARTEQASTGMVAALGTHTGIMPIMQHVGSFSAPGANYACRETSGPTYTDNIDGETLFVANGDAILIGDPDMFSEIEILFTSPGNPGSASIKQTPGSATFFYFNDSETWIEFFPGDDTDGFQHAGVIRFDSGDFTAWKELGDPAGATGDNGYWIKIVRTRNNLGTTPVLATAKILAPTVYLWDEDGNVVVKTVATDASTEPGISLIDSDGAQGKVAVKFHGNLSTVTADAQIGDVTTQAMGAQGNAGTLEDAIVWDGSKRALVVYGSVVPGQETITCAADTCVENIKLQTHFIISEGGAEVDADNLALDNGTIIGQEVTFIFKTESDAGDTIVIDTAQQVGWGSFTMNAVGDSITFIWDGTNWTIKSYFLGTVG